MTPLILANQQHHQMRMMMILCVTIVKKTGHKDDPKTKIEIESYFQEDRVPYNPSVELDILGWWKANSTRYPI
jgi:hypothetical protein